jgi:hypothetical protein
MALDIPMPWLHGPNVAGAIASGAQAGEAGARLQEARESDSAHLAQQAMQHSQQLQMEGARLSQQEHIAKMEMQSRKEIAEQNRLRQDQQLAMQGAYHDAQIGMAKSRLEESKAIADQKSKDAAMAFQREQAFAADVSSGTNIMDAYRKNPVSASVLSAITRTQLKEGQGGKPVIREGKFPLIEYDPVTRKATTVYTPPESTTISKADTEDLRDLRHERDALEKKLSGKAFAQRVGMANPEENQKDEHRLLEITNRINEIKRGPTKTPPPLQDRPAPPAAIAPPAAPAAAPAVPVAAPAPPAAAVAPPKPKSKIQRAHELGIAHPDWTKEQIIKAVNEEMQ